MKIGIIGSGKFGSLLKVIFEGLGYEVVVSSKSQNLPITSLANCDYIFPCVPISTLENVIIDLKPALKGNEVVVDVCSIKSYPERVYKKHLSNSQVILTHPNFGPESYRLNNNSVENLNWIVWNLSSQDSTMQDFLEILAKLKVKIIEMNPEDHDKIIGLPHFTSMLVGQVLKGLELQKTDYQAASTKRMFEMIQGVGDDWGILLDMATYNAYCKEFLEKFEGNLAKTIAKLRV